MLHAIVDADAAVRAGWRPGDLALAYLEGGARVLQVRAKRLPSGDLLALCDAVVAAAAPFGATVIVNDRADLVLLSGAAGVHVGQDDLPPRQARAVLGAGAIVGFSTHTLEQVEKALPEPVSYIAVGPVFATSTKETGYEAVGLDLVRAAVKRAGGVPIVAIGGITLDRAPALIDAGASGVAVIGDLLAAGDPAKRVASYLARLAAGR